MKSGEKKQTVKLKVNHDINFHLLGISSHENDYRVVWAINEQLKMKFLRIDNLLAHHAKIGQDFEFSRYLFDDEDRYLRFYLISNRCEDGFLFPEVKNFDFLLQIIGETTETEIKTLIKKIKQVSVVSAVYLLQPQKIKGIGEVLNY